jgi:hypothetical protein
MQEIIAKILVSQNDGKNKSYPKFELLPNLKRPDIMLK